jgi:hypothetical protein
MSEKKGNTVKLQYDFDTSKNLEIYLPNLNDWYRVTPGEFRSFNGKRRIQQQNYNGPIYQYGTNNKVNSRDYPLDKYVEYNWVSKRRPTETF